MPLFVTSKDRVQACMDTGPCKTDCPHSPKLLTDSFSCTMCGTCIVRLHSIAVPITSYDPEEASSDFFSEIPSFAGLRCPGLPLVIEHLEDPTIL